VENPPVNDIMIADQPVLLSLAAQDLLETSDLLDASLALRLAAYREGFQLGREHGYWAGYAAAHAELEASYHQLARHVIRGEAFAALERRRRLGGRAHFSDPGPGGQRVAAQDE
jgi:hypothetical protein